jgi:hypothetical protein
MTVLIESNTTIPTKKITSILYCCRFSTNSWNSRIARS